MEKVLKEVKKFGKIVVVVFIKEENYCFILFLDDIKFLKEEIGYLYIMFNNIIFGI